MTEQQQNPDPAAAADTPEAILAAVGDDREKAAAALLAENAKERPRKQLQRRLHEIADPGAAPAVDDAEEAPATTVTYVNGKTGKEVTYARRNKALEGSPAWSVKGAKPEGD